MAIIPRVLFLRDLALIYFGIDVLWLYWPTWVKVTQVKATEVEVTKVEVTTMKVFGVNVTDWVNVQLLLTIKVVKFVFAGSSCKKMKSWMSFFKVSC